MTPYKNTRHQNHPHLLMILATLLLLHSPSNANPDCYEIYEYSDICTVCTPDLYGDYIKCVISTAGTACSLRISDGYSCAEFIDVCTGVKYHYFSAEDCESEMHGATAGFCDIEYVRAELNTSEPCDD